MSTATWCVLSFVTCSVISRYLTLKYIDHKYDDFGSKKSEAL